MSSLAVESWDPVDEKRGPAWERDTPPRKSQLKVAIAAGLLLVGIVVVAVAFAGHDKEQKQNAAPGVLTGTVGDV